MRTPRPFAALLAVLTVALVACTSEPATPPAVQTGSLPPIELEGDWTWTSQPEPLELGITHTQESLDSHDPEEARQRGIDILSADGAIWENHHLMGFGTDNPEPSPGDYNWDTLDARMATTEQTGNKPMLTLCCSPDWMKGGEEGDTDWNELEEAPTPDHYGDYARLAAEAVKRYPQVERVMVWNELKGFWSDEQQRWDYEGFTDFYNQVYQAVKAVRSDVQVGGPYPVIISLEQGGSDASTQLTGPWGAADQRTLDVLDYWLKNNVGADFLTVDASTQIRDEEQTFDGIVGAQKYADIARWIKERSDLPIWWAEFYPQVPQGGSDKGTSPENAGVTIAALAAMAESGSAGALLWGPQEHDLESAALWTDATEEDGGEPTPLTQSWQWLVPRLADGNVEIGRSASRPSLVAFRASDGVVVANVSDDDAELAPGQPMEAWEIRVGGRD